MKHWLVGVAINIVGSLMVNFGTNMMKSSHNNNDKEKANDDDDNSSISISNTVNSNITTDALLEAKKIIPKKEWNHTWRIGISFFTIGSLLNFVSFAFAAQSLLAALGGIQFVSNVISLSLLLLSSSSSL